jgi:hypothetical protein
MLDFVDPRPSDGSRPLALSRAARVLLWDFPRGSLAYDLIVLVLVLLLLLAPAGLWRDPMVSWP